jgi:hypothetical protein
MESIFSQFLFDNWQRKLVAVLAAIVIWVFVNHSITGTKTITQVPIRVINLPEDKTVIGLLPNGILAKRLTVTLTGTKDVIEQLEPGDLEIVLDVSNIPDEWIVQITKKNLVSLNPSIDLIRHVTQVTYNEFVLKMSRLMTAKIPIAIGKPIGNPPKEYEYLDIWPKQFMHTVSGPEEQVQKMKLEGIELIFDLDSITKTDLDTIRSQQKGSDEVSFIVPNKWKQVSIPFLNNALEEINDPEAQNLRIDFLWQQILPIGENIPIRLFFPIKNLEQFNPETVSLQENPFMHSKKGVFLFSLPLVTYNVSRTFLDIIKENIEIAIIVDPKGEKKNLQWSVEFLDPIALENRYVDFFISASKKSKSPFNGALKEKYLRQRFKDYMQKFALYRSLNQQLRLENTLEDHKVIVREGPRP